MAFRGTDSLILWVMFLHHNSIKIYGTWNSLAKLFMWYNRYLGSRKMCLASSSGSYLDSFSSGSSWASSSWRACYNCYSEGVESFFFCNSVTSARVKNLFFDFLRICMVYRRDVSWSDLISLSVFSRMQNRIFLILDWGHNMDVNCNNTNSS